MFNSTFSALLISMLAAFAPAMAGSFPDRPIKIVVPQPAASGGDVLARMLAEKMSADLGKPVVVENRPGANGLLAADLVKSDTSRGYTLMLTGVSVLSFNGALYKNLPYRPFEDFSFIASIADTSFILVASRKSEIKTVRDLRDRAMENPNLLTYASAGVGNSSHLAAEMIMRSMGIRLLHVPYRGSAQILNALTSGEVDLTVGIPSSSLPLLKEGRITALAVMGSDRIQELPQVPTLKESGFEIPSMPGWYALVGPANIPADIIQQLSDTVRRFVASPDTQEKLRNMSLTPSFSTSQEIRARAVEDARVWGGFIRENGIQLDQRS